jgi:hypothetical protein
VHERVKGIVTADPRPTLAYVVGTTDCGSTLSAFVLGSHPDICALGEPPKRSIRRRGDSFVCSCGQTIGQCAFWQALFARLRGGGLHFSETVWPTDYRYRNDVVNRVLTRYQFSGSRRALQAAAGFLWPLHGRRMRRATRSNSEFVRAALAQTGKRVFLDTSKDLFRFQQFRRVGDWNLKVIRLVRDVRWFVYTRRRRTPPAKAASHWREFQLAADRALQEWPSQRQTILRYEDLCDDPAGSARRIHAFLGLPACDPPGEYDPAAYHIIGDGIGGRFTISTEEKWRTGLTREAQETALRIAGDVNRRFGYA